MCRAKNHTFPAKLQSLIMDLANSLGVYLKKVNAWFKDAAGNVSESVSASISLGVYDTTAPTAVSVVIDNGTASTTNATVTLTSDATDDVGVTEYFASEFSTTPQAVDSGWDNYSTSVRCTFDNDTIETKTVNAWFKDAAGNVSDSVADTIERVGLSGVADRMSAGNYHTCAIKADDSVQCWGRNNWGQSSVPSGLGSVKSVAAGGGHTCAIKTDDSLQCWGRNN